MDAVFKGRQVVAINCVARFELKKVTKPGKVSIAGDDQVCNTLLPFMNGITTNISLVRILRGAWCQNLGIPKHAAVVI